MLKIHIIELSEDQVQVVMMPEPTTSKILKVGLRARDNRPCIWIGADSLAKLNVPHHVYRHSDVFNTIEEYEGDYLGSYQKDRDDYHLFMKKIEQ